MEETEILELLEKNPGLLVDLFFAAHCPKLVATQLSAPEAVPFRPVGEGDNVTYVPSPLVRNAEALCAAGLLDEKSRTVPPGVVSVVRDEQVQRAFVKIFLGYNLV